MIFSTIHHRLKCKCSRLYGINTYILGVSFKYYNTNKIIKNTSDIKIKIYIYFFFYYTNYLRISGIGDGMDKQLVAKNITKGTWRSMVVATARFEREIISRGVENYGTWHRLAISLTPPFLLHSQFLLRITQFKRSNICLVSIFIAPSCRLNPLAN